MKFITLISIIGFFLIKVEAFPQPTGVYSNHYVLKQPDLYEFYWNYTETNITFEVLVKTKGWFGFGISPNGGMQNSDVVVGWINADQSVNFTDRHIKNDTKVLIDRKQDWHLLHASRVDEHLRFKFTRRIKICDPDKEDIDIPQGTPSIIYSFGQNFRNGDISYHGPQRGQISLPLINTINKPINLNMDKIQTYDFRVDAVIPSDRDTTYHCHMFKLPHEIIQKKRHLVRFDTLVQPGNEHFVHHWLFYECSLNFESQIINDEFPQPGHCYYENPNEKMTMMNMAKQNCNKISLAWAIGGSYIQDIPEQMAYPLGGSDDEFKYFILEIHYDNPHFKSVRDTSGIRLYTTTEYRPIEFGVLQNGVPSEWWALTLPPGSNRFEVDHHCRKECLNDIYGGGDDKSSENITIISSLPHTHLKGVELYTKVIRDNKEIEYVTNNAYYNFNYQNYNFLQKPIVLRKNDELLTQCVYKTTSTNKFTLGGLSTKEGKINDYLVWLSKFQNFLFFSNFKEMCIDFIWYYPRKKEFPVCESSNDVY